MVGSLEDPPSSTPLPDPLVEEPPNDRWCDIVMKGGVASGVVYPWAILEIARKYRLRNLGGTSVGAMAASIAAACEYGRRQGHPHAFEVLRHLPSELGKRPDSTKDDDGSQPETTMLSLFQPAEKGMRLFAVFLAILNVIYPKNQSAEKKQSSSKYHVFRTILKHYFNTRLVIKTILISFILFYATHRVLDHLPTNIALLQTVTLHVLGICIVVMIFWVIIKELCFDIRHGILKNDLGLCRGKSQPNKSGESHPALVEWIHEAVQRGAGLPIDGPPLTFEDLWNAPLWPGGSSPQLDQNGVPLERSINLEMVTTNVTHGRPYRLPLSDRNARLFFDPDSWDKFFPPQVMDSLRQVSKPYTPLTDSDPSKPPGTERLFELPRGKLPIVVAARLSLSYPLLFSAVPLYAIDYEQPEPEARKLRLCRFSDGGLCSNFPVHFFDSALPRWPTFGLSLEVQNSYKKSGINKTVWLPSNQGEGQYDSWYRIEPKNSANPEQQSDPAGVAGSSGNPHSANFSTLTNFLWSSYLSSKDWRDRTATKMPHVRRRVVRLRLNSDEGEGQLNISMPKEKILEMAKLYGTEAGIQLCKKYVPNTAGSEPSDAWREHLWVRLQILLEGLSDLLDNVSAASTSQGHTIDTNNLLQTATEHPPIKNDNDTRRIWDSQRDELRDLVTRIAELESALSSRSNLPHGPQPLPELRLRPPL